ncbi:MAG: hypothetical protein D6724_00810 [Armatimonadetes bacterium]|nr:MAG: hypothetical protein D6724_00810 [Armatimonadota bacterium]
MKRIAIVLLAGLAAIAAAQGGWKYPDAIRATVREEAKDQPARSMEILQSGENARFLTSVPLEGELDGIPRVEVIGPSGVFTWLDGKPQYVLPLLYPSTFDAYEFLARPRFSRADLEFNLQGIEHALKKRVLVGPTEEVAGRECLVLIVPDRPDSTRTDYQKLWIDRETGLTMRIEDYMAGDLRYRREISKIEFPDGVDASSFQPAPNAIQVRGLVAPSALLYLPGLRSEQDIARDISRIQAQSSIQSWFKSPPLPEGFKYAVTRYREARSYSVQWGRQSNRGRGNQFAQAPRQRQFVIRDSSGNTRVIQIETDDRGGRNVVIRTDSGQMVLRPGQGGDDPTTASGSSSATGSQAGATNSGQVVQTDWVDPSTGHTVSLFQVNGRPVETVLSRLLLPEPKAIANRTLSDAKFYEVQIPISCRVLTWKSGQVAYALVSTKMSEGQMTKFAENLVSAR